jgi:hypothetical protein
VKTLRRARIGGGPGDGPVLQEGKGFYIGFDLGQSVDHSALCVLERVADWEHASQPVKHHIRSVKR